VPYISWCVGDGVRVLAVLFWAKNLAQDNAPGSLRNELSAMSPSHKEIFCQILNNFVACAFGVIALVGACLRPCFNES
jgi:hypothetical protein